MAQVPKRQESDKKNLTNMHIKVVISRTRFLITDAMRLIRKKHYVQGNIPIVLHYCRVCSYRTLLVRLLVQELGQTLQSHLFTLPCHMHFQPAQILPSNSFLFCFQLCSSFLSDSFKCQLHCLTRRFHLELFAHLAVFRLFFFR